VHLLAVWLILSLIPLARFTCACIVVLRTAGFLSSRQFGPLGFRHLLRLSADTLGT
jgi:hypothetical protein